MAAPSPIKDVKKVSPISTFVLNTLTLKWRAFFLTIYPLLFNRHTDYSMSDPISVVSLLCEAMAEQGKDVKAQVNHQDNFGQTPLHRAALRGSTICSLNLIQVGKKESLVFAELRLWCTKSHRRAFLSFFFSFARYFELSWKPPNIKLFLLDSIDSISSYNELNLRALGSTKLTTT